MQCIFADSTQARPLGSGALFVVIARLVSRSASAAGGLAWARRWLYERGSCRVLAAAPRLHRVGLSSPPRYSPLFLVPSEAAAPLPPLPVSAV